MHQRSTRRVPLPWPECSSDRLQHPACDPGGKKMSKKKKRWWLFNINDGYTHLGMKYSGCLDAVLKVWTEIDILFSPFEDIFLLMLNVWLVLLPKLINPLMLSVCLILPTCLLSLSLSAFWVVTTKGWMHDECRLKACHYKSCARVPMLWLTSVLHSASHSLHMSCTAPSSIRANVRGGWLHPHMPCRVWPVGWAVFPKHAAYAGVAAQDPRRTVGSHEGQTGSTRCPIRVHPHLTAVFLSLPATEHHRRLLLQRSSYSLTCTPARARQPLW